MCAKKHISRTVNKWIKSVDYFNLNIFQSQYPSCNIITIVLQNVTSMEIGKHVHRFLYFLQLYVNLQLLKD